MEICGTATAGARMADQVEVGRAPGMPLTAAAPLLCVAHCLAAPVLVVMAPALAGNGSVEIALMVISTMIAVTVLVTGVRRHGESLVWMPAIAGLSLWLLGLIIPGEMQERALMACGGILLAGGLFWDARLRHRASCTGCSGGD
jgi:drug/metabolite transporter superfamily protein YnfA